ncbi:cupin domain-containing protein [Haloarchaeobius baliensis]|uniref:cupin domain-containing protein n=1 Tax=Haloarchaeobius baliensis TaxID=1670458 RepID=UPI003F881316
MNRCPQPGCSWQALAASADGARTAYLEHVVTDHAGADDPDSVDWFERSPGETSERRSHDHERVVIVLEGDLVLHTEDDSIELSTSDSMLIEAGEPYHSENPGEHPCLGITAAAQGS